MADDILMESPTVDSPLSDRAAVVIAGKLHIEEQPLLGKITLRGRSDNAKFMKAAKAVLGVALPTEPMTSVTGRDAIRVFWKAFDEWLIWTPKDGEGALIAALRDSLSGDLRKAIVDVSDYYTVIRVSGPLSRALLAKGVALDLHLNVFTEGTATGTGFHQATIFMTRTQADVYDVMIRWSFADYLYSYFEDGAREWA